MLFMATGGDEILMIFLNTAKTGHYRRHCLFWTAAQKRYKSLFSSKTHGKGSKMWRERPFLGCLTDFYSIYFDSFSIFGELLTSLLDL